MNVTYDKIVGHKRPIRILKAAVTSGRIPHAYLFAGPDGIGKRTCAFALAAALNCEKMDDQACGECPGCRKISQSNHPDVSLVEKEGKFIKIEQVREISRTIHFPPYEGKTRVIIFDEAESMNPSAANALLKTLEEPRPNNVLILVTANPQQLLPTILSRCQRINFNPLAVDEVEQVLLDTGEHEKAESALMARLSGGSIGRVLQEDMAAMVEKRRELLIALSEVEPADEIAVADFADMLIQSSNEMEATLEMIKAFLKDAVVMAGTGSENMIVNIDVVEQLRNYCGRYSPERLLAMARSVGYAQRLLMRNVNKGLVASSLALELVHPKGGGFDSLRMPR